MSSEKFIFIENRAGFIDAVTNALKTYLCHSDYKSIAEAREALADEISVSGRTLRNWTNLSHVPEKISSTTFYSFVVRILKLSPSTSLAWLKSIIGCTDLSHKPSGALDKQSFIEILMLITPEDDQKELESFAESVFAPLLERLLHQLALDNFYAVDYPLALDYAKRSREAALTTGNLLLIADIYTLIAIIKCFTDKEDVLLNLRRAQDIYEKLRSVEGLVEVKRVEGIYWEEKGEYQKAMQCFRAAFEDAEINGFDESLCHLYGHVGNMLIFDKDFSTAEEYYEKGLALAKSLGNERLQGVHFGNLGNLHDEFDEYPKAMLMYGHALEISRRIGDKFNEAIHAGNVGHIYSCLGYEEFDPQKKEQYFRDAIDRFTVAYNSAAEISDRLGMCIARTNQCQILVELKDLSDANKMLNEAKYLNQSLQNKDMMEKIEDLENQLKNQE